jgi:GNAT superfamily N-acetyltransferase
MTTAITLAGTEHATQVLGLMARFHEDAGLPYDDAHRSTVAEPLLDGSPLGAIWLIGPGRAPLGYVMISFGWSVADGGMVGRLEEVYIRASVRNRGIGTEVMHAVTVNLRQAGLRAMHVQLQADAPAAAFCKRVGFAPVTGVIHMAETL